MRDAFAFAKVQGSRLLTVANVAAAVAAGKAKQLDRAELRSERVLLELARVAFVDGRTYFDADGNAKSVTELTEEQGARLAGFEVLIKNAKAGDGVTDLIHKIKFWDKMRALEMLAKHFALQVDCVEQTGAGGRPLTLEVARKMSDEEIEARLAALAVMLLPPRAGPR